MRIAIVGAGHVGTALGTAWARASHDVVYGSRDPAVRQREDGLAREARPVLSVTEAVSTSEVVVLAVPWPAARQTVESIGPALADKVLIDVTNPLKGDFSGLEEGYAVSGGERIAGWADGARVVKAFNQTSFENMADAHAYASPRPVMFACSDDRAAVALTVGLADDAGFEGVDAGPLSIARLLEPLGMLWIHLARAQGLGRDFAFGLVRKSAAIGGDSRPSPPHAAS